MSNNKLKKMRYILCTFLVIIVLLFLVNFLFTKVIYRNIVCGKITAIKIEEVKEGDANNGSIPKDVKEKVLSNLNEYAFLVYEIDVTNNSSKIDIHQLDLKPLFSQSMKKNVIWYDGTDFIIDDSGVAARHTRQCYRYILVKRNDCSDKELINIANKDEFKISFSFLDFLVSSIKVGK